MTTRQLEVYVKKRFDMGICEFMKHKVEAESLYDYELASLLNVDGAFISKLRKAFGIKRANGFPRRFESTYGKGAVDTFKKIIENPDNTLIDVASHFGFSREYARQVYKKLYGRPYTEIFREKILARKRKKLEAKMKSTRFVSLAEVIEKMSCLGFVPRITNKGPAFTIFVNGYKLALRCTSKPILLGRKHYFRISNGIGSNMDYDFVICLCMNNGKSTHYVIPRHAMPRYGVSIPIEAGPLESKYAKFREAWHLLAHENRREEVS
ncbi:MAG: AraC family transcriptional regulator [Deltaproteobacteria bacterium]|nr:AraC family transcriptional regulator [Deltaproteobacteria bacterium]MBW2019749.1 AraC family transcriptional regulator [Deltaproteobacteria bacterium]MBW2074583.1 AraC family transcriptional regulator [Deltaproteobacteria bacterium]RLB83440.1 MAG: hypothetical protein DRH17_02155 [Deltaproteobacteria bacterium]